jgi:hypothetical protein
MSSSKTRTRRRVSPWPFPASPNITLGKFQSWNVSQKKWVDVSGPPSYSLNSSFGPGLEGQVTMDELHDGPPYKEGGPFKSLRLQSCLPFAAVVGAGTFYRQDQLRRYIGGFRIPNTVDFGSPANFTPFSTNLDLNNPRFPSLDDWGDKAYNGLKPRLAKAGAGVFLAELRDLPRMLSTTSKGFHSLWANIGQQRSWRMSPKKAADHFINHQFGWIPFLSDLQKFYHTFLHTGSILDKMKRENGQWIRKRITLKDEASSTLVGGGSGTVVFPTSELSNPTVSSWFASGATWQLWEDVHYVITSSGKFRYYRPEFDGSRPDYMSVMNQLSRHMTIYGARINPSNIYRATPWTWAADWISNLGDYVDRANDMLADSVASQYLFVMQHKIVKRRLIQFLPWHSGTQTLMFERVIETKQRSEGLSPYGFSLSMASLTPRQLAIAGALGISRS